MQVTTFLSLLCAKKPKTKHEKSKFIGRAYSKLNEDTFRVDINEYNWDCVMNCHDSNEAWEIFRETFQTILFKHAPQKVYNTRADRQPWVCTQFLESANERDELQKRAAKTQSPLDSLRAKIVQNRTVSLIRNLKSMFFQNSIQEAGSDSAKLWKTLKRILRNSTKKDQITQIGESTDPVEIVNSINSFFANIGSELSERIAPSTLELNFDSIPNIPFLELELTTPEEVSKLLMSISDAKATGDDETPVRFLKMCIDTVSILLCYVINLSITTGVVPARWKTAVVTPLYKEGDRCSASNYLPISVLPVALKVMERIVHNQIYAHLRKYSLLSEAQFGFRKYHSTSTCILKLLNNIYLNMDKGMMTGVVFLDLKKAFDTVDHTILIKN